MTRLGPSKQLPSWWSYGQDRLKAAGGSAVCRSASVPRVRSPCPPRPTSDLLRSSSCSRAPAANQCDGTMLKTYYDPNGTCSGGVCSYRFTTQDCPRGCQDGACITHVCTPGSAVFTSDVTDVASLATVGPLPALAGGAGYEI